MTKSSSIDPTIHDLLEDPLTHMVMRADHVDPLTLRQMLGSVAVKVQSPERQPDYEPRWYGVPSGRIGVGQWIRAQLCGAC